MIELYGEYIFIIITLIVVGLRFFYQKNLNNAK